MWLSGLAGRSKDLAFSCHSLPLSLPVFASGKSNGAGVTLKFDRYICYNSPWSVGHSVLQAVCKTCMQTHCGGEETLSQIPTIANFRSSSLHLSLSLCQFLFALTSTTYIPSSRFGARLHHRFLYLGRAWTMVPLHPACPLAFFLILF